MGAVLRVLARVLGIELLARLARRLPGRGPWVAALVLLVAVNLLPVWAVLRGSATVGDVFVVYWAENVVVWLVTVVRVATARGTAGPAATMQVNGRPTTVGAIGLAAFFAFHYGIFTLVHGAFTAFIVSLTGLTASREALVVLVAAIVASHLVSLGLVWFGRGERRVVSPSQAMSAPYPRMLALHVAIIGGFFFLLGGAGEGGPLAGALGINAGVAILCLVKTGIDVGFHLRAWRRLPEVPASRPGDFYGGPAAA